MDKLYSLFKKPFVLLKISFEQDLTPTIPNVRRMPHQKRYGNILVRHGQDVLPWAAFTKRDIRILEMHRWGMVQNRLRTTALDTKFKLYSTCIKW